MINISAKDKEECRSNTSALRQVLEKQLELVRDDLESLPLDRIARQQGYGAALRDVINLLPK
jgi:formate dehydrogenase maturation protein FdhE